MRTKSIHLTAVLLALVLLLTGCGFDGFLDYLDEAYGHYDTVAFSDMAYTRPDMAELQNILSDTCSLAQTETSLSTLVRSINAFYRAYDKFYTNYNLADIYYCKDLTDSYWEEEYTFCAQNAPEADAALDTLLRALADSPLRKQLESDKYFGADFFSAYEGETVWDADFVALLEQEAALQSQYYTLTNDSATYFPAHSVQLADLFVDLVELRQKIAAYAGYSSYPAFAYDYYFYRDYTPMQAEDFMTNIGSSLYDLYCRVGQSDIWDLAADYSSEQDTFRYVKDAAVAMGGTVSEAFSLLEEAELYDIRYSANKYSSSFELYLWSYYEPFIFMNSYMDQTDKLTFAHEFGHFANDYICNGSTVGIDIAEVHSQGFEYLSLCYNEDAEDLAKYKLADSLATYMDCSAYALFEHRVYSLTGSDLTVENVHALYEQIGTQFGFNIGDWNSWDFVTVSHFFTDPMYMVSYVVSNDLAMQFYQKELDAPGSGLALYQQCLTSQDSYIVSFAQQYGLESPFEEGRLQKVCQSFQTLLPTNP